MHKQKGFTLVELMIALAITAVVLLSVYMAYISQQKNYVYNEQTATMHQTLRAASLIMERDLRAAGEYRFSTANPPPGGGALLFPLPGFVQANQRSFRITKDANGDNDILDPDEDITYTITPDNPDVDPPIIGTIQRIRPNSPVEVIAENISDMNFLYLESGVTIMNGGGGGVPPLDLDKIWAVMVNIVARSERPDPTYVNQTNYFNQNGDLFFTPPLVPIRDHYWRKQLTLTVQGRNLSYR